MNPETGKTFSRITSRATRLASSRAASWLLLGAFFWMVSAAAFSGFLNKWGLMGTEGKAEQEQRYGLPLVLDGTANKPFVYRQLAPMLANAAEKLAPEGVKFHAKRLLLPKAQRDRLIAAPPAELRFRYLVIHQLGFFALLLSLFVLRRILLDLGAGGHAAILAPAAFALAFPYIQTMGGFYYDTIELLSMSVAFLFALRGRILPLVALAFPAALNKETFIFFLPALYPLLRHKLAVKPAAVTIAAAILAAGLVNVVLKLHFAGAGRGGVAEFHMLDNLRYYLNPLSYLNAFEFTYGIIGPRHVFVGTLLVAAIVVARGWPAAPVFVRRHLLVAAAINLPLFLLFCAPGELRNLSMLYVGMVAMTGFTIGGNSQRTGETLSP